MYPSNVNDIKDAGVRNRVKIERRIVRSLVSEFLAQGFYLAVDDGERMTPKTRDTEVIFDALMETDEDRLFVYREKNEEGKYPRIGGIFLVYGNDGWDVMSDWHTALDPFMPETLALVDKLG